MFSKSLCYCSSPVPHTSSHLVAPLSILQLEALSMPPRRQPQMDPDAIAENAQAITNMKAELDSLRAIIDAQQATIANLQRSAASGSQPEEARTSSSSIAQNLKAPPIPSFLSQTR